MIFWKSLRVSLLALTFGGVILVLGKSVFGTASEKRLTAKAFEFPTNVPLPSWQSLGSQPLMEPLGRNYQYRQGDLKLIIEMRYVESSFENEALFRKYNPSVLSPGELTPTIRYHRAIGAYSLSLNEQRAYLRACINPRADSAITYTQLIQNRYKTDLRFSRLLPWLMDQESLLDNRCLWTHLSLPIKDSSPEQAYQTLESTWLPWYEWWHSRFSQ